jgi:hypothetical protein
MSLWSCVWYIHGLTTRRPSFGGAAARLNDYNHVSISSRISTRERIRTLSHSSHARPAPKPRPTNAGHARRLKRRTEKTTPKPRPRPERMTIEERQRSHWECIVSIYVLSTAIAARVRQCSTCSPSDSRHVANGSCIEVFQLLEMTTWTRQLVLSRAHHHRGIGGCTFSFSRASLIGRVVRGMGAVVFGDSSDIASVYVRVQLI